MPPSRTTRTAIAITAAILAGALTYAITLRYPSVQGLDFTWLWRAARALLDGQNPYAVIQPTGPYPFSSGFYYPLPAAFLALPVAWLPVNVAAAVFVAACSGVFAFALTVDGYHRLPLLMSAPMVSAVLTAQSAPLFAASVLIPALQLFAICKPNLGVAAFAYRPTWWPVVGAVIACALSFILVPTWLWDWVAVLRADPGVHVVPVLVPLGGFLLVLAVFRWRQPDARLLMAMSSVGQTMTFYDPLPVTLCARTFRESLVLALLSQLAMVGTLRYGAAFATMPEMFRQGAPFALWSIYVPALAMVLRRPNREGPE